MNNTSICILCGHDWSKHQVRWFSWDKLLRVECIEETGQREENCKCTAGFKDVKVTVTMD